MLGSGLFPAPHVVQGLALPRQGGGIFFLISICLPSPRAGEGRVRGYIANFSHLPFFKGGNSNLLPLLKGG